MISTGEMPTYFTADVITYTCNSGYTQKNVRDIRCVCDVSYTVDWTCTIDVTNFENECEKGEYNDFEAIVIFLSMITMN